MLKIQKYLTPKYFDTEPRGIFIPANKYKQQNTIFKLQCILEVVPTPFIISVHAAKI